ncbi:unnamed protein product, partial [Hapterophycus canaliculatus]
QVSIDVRAPSAGTLLEQMAGDGDTVEVGAPLMKLDTSGGGGGAPGERFVFYQACKIPGPAA